MSRSTNNVSTTTGGGFTMEDNFVLNNDENPTDSGLLYKHDNQYDGFVRKNSDGEIYLVKNENEPTSYTFSTLGTLNANTIKCDNIYSTQSTTINSINLIDNSIILNKNSASDVNDTGIYFQHANNLYTGLVRDQSKEFNFVNLSSLPVNTTTTFDNTQLTDIKLRDIKVNRDLYIYNSNSYVNTINTSNSQSSNLTLTLPLTAGSNGAILQTNGSGQTSWNTSIAVDITSLQNRIQDENVEIGKFAGQNNHSTYGIAIGYNAGRHTQGEDGIAIGREAGHSLQGVNSIAIGYLSGFQSQSSYCVALGYASGNTAQGVYSVAIGVQSGQNNQGSNCISIGNSCGYLSQGERSIAIGNNSAFDNQKEQAIAIGYTAGYTNQGAYSIAFGSNSGYLNQQSSGIAIGYQAGYNTQGQHSISIGTNSGYSQQSFNSVAIGNEAGQYTQSARAVAIGRATGRYGQGDSAVAVGRDAGFDNQKEQATALGYASGYSNQGTYSIAVGRLAGFNNQNSSAIAIGDSAGYNTQGQHSISIGTNSGYQIQGPYSIAIGYNAGRTNQSSQSIAINASSTDLTANQQGCFINPVRNVNSNQNIITYDTSTKELTYDSALYSTIINNYMTSDNFYLYPPTSAYRVMSLQPSLADDNTGGFKKNFYLVPFNATITDVVIENIGENNPVKYDIRITKQSGATTTSTTDTITMSSALTNPSGIANFTSVSYYNTLPTYESYLKHYYPFSYNFVNVADQINYRQLIGTGGFTNEAVKLGIASYKYTPYNSLSTANLINLNGTGSRNTSGGIFANGYTLIAFWFNVQHNFYANNQNSLLFALQGLGTGTGKQNNNFNVFLRNPDDTFPSGEPGFAYQIDLTPAYNWTGSSATNENYNSGLRQVIHNTWNHFAMYITPTRFIIWVNGQTWIYSAERNWFWEHSYLTLGNFPFANQNDWSGLTGYMNDLRIYNGTTDYLGDWASYSTLGTTYPKINNFFSNSNITTSSNAVGNSNFISLASPVSVVKGDRIYMELKESGANVSNFDELVSAKLLLKAS